MPSQFGVGICGRIWSESSIGEFRKTEELSARALGGAYSITPAPRVEKASEVVPARSNQISRPHAKGDPTFAILPRPAPSAGH